MDFDWALIGLAGRLILVNVVPFFLAFHLVMQRRKKLAGAHFSELALIGGELQTVGILGYFVILSIYFCSIPVLNYINTKPGYEILYVAPEPETVLILAVISFSLVVAGIFLRWKKRWAYHLAYFVVSLLMFYAFLSILHYGWVSIVPVVLFSYLLFRLTRESLKRELSK